MAEERQNRRTTSTHKTHKLEDVVEVGSESQVSHQLENICKIRLRKCEDGDQIHSSLACSASGLLSYPHLMHCISLLNPCCVMWSSLLGPSQKSRCSICFVLQFVTCADFPRRTIIAIHGLRTGPEYYVRIHHHNCYGTRCDQSFSIIYLKLCEAVGL